MIETIAALALLIAVLLLLAMMPLALLWLLYRHGLITWEELEQAAQRMADGQVRL